MSAVFIKKTHVCCVLCGLCESVFGLECFKSYGAAGVKA